MKRINTLTTQATTWHGSDTAQLAADFLTERATRSPSTAESYCSHLAVFLEWTAVQGIDPTAVTRREASRFVAWLSQEKSQHTGRVRTGAAVNACVSACATFLEYAIECGDREEGRNPFQAVTRPVQTRQPARGRLTISEVNRMVLAAREDHVLGGTLGKVIIGSLALVGVRPTDLCRLDLDDVADDGEGGYELRLTVKRGKQLTRWMPPQVAADVYTYLQRGRRRPDEEEQGRPLLVHPRLHRRVTRCDVLLLVKRCAKAAGLPDAATMTSREFRRFFLTTSRVAGADLEDRQRAAGHVDARTTAIYDGTTWSRARDPAIRIAAMFEDYPAEQLQRPLQHATVAEPRSSSKYDCDCTPRWAHARVWLGPVGIDQYARIHVTDQYEPGTAALDAPACPVCHGIYLGPFRVAAVEREDTALLETARAALNDRARFPAGMDRADDDMKE